MKWPLFGINGMDSGLQFGKSKINKGQSARREDGMCRKLVRCLVLLGAVIALGMSAVPAYAAESGTGYVVLRCTVTMSVSLVSGSTSYDFGDISAATTQYSTTPITFLNDSIGAICKWELNMDNASLEGWTLGNTPGLDQAAIFGIFKKTGQPSSSDFDMVNDTMSTTAVEYDAARYFDADYNADGHQDQGFRILPKAYADTVGKTAERKLWLKLLAPLAVTDQNTRIINLVITVAMAG